ncbi:MAG: phasin family protein [Hyphomicrobium sp.]|jgi:hypothetical protein
MTRPKDDALASLAQFNPWIASVAPFMGTSVKLTETMRTQATAVASELSDFTMRRIQEDVRLSERIAGCRSAQDWQQIWAEYWKKTFAQYQNEWSRLASINQGNVAALSEVAAELQPIDRKTRMAA